MAVLSSRQLCSVLLPPEGQRVCNRGLFGMTTVCQNLATAQLLTREQLRGCRLSQSSPYPHRKASNSLLTTQTRGYAIGKTLGKRFKVYCDPNTGQHALSQQKGPNISLLQPHLQKQWDHAANAGLGDIDIRPNSTTKVQWICDQCPDGHLHSWSARICDRTRGRACPQCRGTIVCKHSSLATKAPLVAAQWDYEANDGTPDDVTAQSSRPVHWLCAVCGHKWKATPDGRVGKMRSGCRKCANQALTNKRIKQPTFAECQHPLLAEWDHQRNEVAANFPENTTLKSHKKIVWFCTKCPRGQEHRWAASPNSRTRCNKPGCPFCAGQAPCKCNSLQALYPDIAAEWDYAQNKDQPSDYTASSSHVAWWFSSQRGSWQQKIKLRTDPRLSRHRERRNSM